MPVHVTHAHRVGAPAAVAENSEVHWISVSLVEISLLAAPGFLYGLFALNESVGVRLNPSCFVKEVVR